MTALYRCRTALSEVAGLFEADAPPQADWSAELWPGRTGLIVRSANAGRVVETMKWGIAGNIADGTRGRPPATTLWFRELFPSRPDWLDPERRCLIIMDSFACPEGPAGARTRTWFGLEHIPLFAWAGIWRENESARGYCGLVAAADDRIRDRGPMPALLRPEEAGEWLLGDLITAGRLARRSYPAEDMYREALDEPWSAPR
ncbi:SOS response-associated peptidase family protein [Sphingomonas colocasiae]|uniref:DUF159 family protein n=1 Tax=Sphingomonas colocasiae TaxID=1848973 RepID=A0ABS7PQ56_9SPHN|nr:SOS response-associated peptidase family protein [Sphingomonas colocasiae]MBY8823448.1 hypothetical protein [Sphingomonas colocasiae]